MPPRCSSAASEFLANPLSAEVLTRFMLSAVSSEPVPVRVLDGYTRSMKRAFDGRIRMGIAGALNPNQQRLLARSHAVGSGPETGRYPVHRATFAG